MQPDLTGNVTGAGRHTRRTIPHMQDPPAGHTHPHEQQGRNQDAASVLPAVPDVCASSYQYTPLSEAGSTGPARRGKINQGWKTRQMPALHPCF